MAKPKPTLNNTDIDLILNRLLLYLPSKQDIEAMENRLGNKYNQTINKLDKVMGELQTKRQEQTAHSGQHRRLNDNVKKHDKRLKKLERVVLTQ